MKIVDRFESAGQQLRNAISGLNKSQMQERPGPGHWSIHELVVHLADSDSIAIDRMKRVITEETPQLLNADETAYVERLFAHDQSLNDAIDLFDIGRRQFAIVLRKLSPDNFQRAGVHNTAGKVTLQQLIEIYCDHFDHHMNFLSQKRENLGSPLS
jgi:uncharacterized damage-inducible protein DinB